MPIKTTSVRLFHVTYQVICHLIIILKENYNTCAAKAGRRSVVGVGKGCALCAWQHAVSQMNVAFPALVR